MRFCDLLPACVTKLKFATVVKGDNPSFNGDGESVNVIFKMLCQHLYTIGFGVYCNESTRFHIDAEKDITVEV